MCVNFGSASRDVGMQQSRQFLRQCDNSYHSSYLGFSRHFRGRQSKKGSPTGEPSCKQRKINRDTLSHSN